MNHEIRVEFTIKADTRDDAERMLYEHLRLWMRDNARGWDELKEWTLLRRDLTATTNDLPT